MADLSTKQNEWHVLAEAAVNVENGLNTDVNTVGLAYGGTWASAAQNPAMAPDIKYLTKLAPDTNGVRMRFLVADTAGDQVTATIWGWDNRGSAPLNLMVLNPITAGESICETAPYINEYTNTTQGVDYLVFTAASGLIENGETITGSTSSSTATVVRTELNFNSGPWAGGAAAGKMWITDASGAFTKAGETITGSSGAATATAVPHRTTPKTASCGNSLVQVPFETGVIAPVVGEGITSTGVTAATVDRVVVTSGAWATGNATGFVYVSSVTGTFQASTATGDIVGATFNPTGAAQKFFYADTLTLTSDHANITTVGTPDGGGILELRFDAVGMTYLWCDFDCDLGLGTDGVNAIAVMKGY